MARAALYSRSRRPGGAGTGDANPAPPPPPPGPWDQHREKLKTFARRFERSLLIGGGVLAALAAVLVYDTAGSKPKALTQTDIDAAVLHTLKNQPAEPSRASVAWEVIRPSVVLVRRMAKNEDADKDKASKEKSSSKGKPNPKIKDKSKAPDIAKDDKSDVPGNDRSKRESTRGLGTGVVISESGLVVTCLHVIAGAERIKVIFGDGTESDVEIASIQPENDLAILKAKDIPDDLVAATLRSTKGLKLGDEVIAVGFPFGIGPSVSNGVISGLRREHDPGEGRRHMVDLIQFDAAANPGNSGGPLVNAEGDVIGIVTSILNPTDKSFFVGIGFAVPIENAASAAGLSPF